MCSVVEEAIRVDCLSTNTGLEMQMRCRGTTCLSDKSDDLSCLDLIAHIHQVLRVVTVIGLQTIVMTYPDQITIPGETT